MFLAIAAQTKRHPKHQNDYQVWYLEMDTAGEVVGIGVKHKEEVISSVFENFSKTGKTNWRAFKKGSQCSTPIEVFDFVAMNMHENTHFGELPTLGEFQQTIDQLNLNFEIKPLAS